MQLDGIHHITAITGDARRNVDFYTRVLGLRLIAKTVNQDDPPSTTSSTATSTPSPGADLTFFEYPGAMPGRPARGWSTASLARRLPEALDFWARATGRRGRRRRRARTARSASATPRGSTTSSS